MDKDGFIAGVWVDEAKTLEPPSLTAEQERSFINHATLKCFVDEGVDGGSVTAYIHKDGRVLITEVRPTGGC